MLRPLLLIVTALLVSCGSGSPPATAPAAAEKAPPPKPADESRRLPRENQTSAEVVNDHLLGKSFMPGGTLGQYRKGKTEYQMFVAAMPSPTDAAILLLDWKKAMPDAQLVASFGGYAGTDAGRPVFVFTKGSWIAGVAGLPQKQADLQARLLAMHLD